MGLFDGRGVQLPIREIHRNLIVGEDGLWAWYVLRTVPWAFQETADRNTHRRGTALRLSELSGRRIHIRTTLQPFPYQRWARLLDKDSPHALPPTPGAETFADALTVGQRVIAGSDSWVAVTYLGVRVTTRVPDSHLQCLLAGPEKWHRGEPDWVQRAWQEIQSIDGVVARDGLNGAPVSSRGLAWLIHASTAIGCPVSKNALVGPSDRWTREDMRSFTDPVNITSIPFAPHLTVSAVRDGREHTRQVSVLTVGRLPEIEPNDPSRWPWMAYTNALPFPVEWSAIADVFDGKTLGNEMTRRANIAIDQAEHYEENGYEPPVQVDRVHKDAHRILDEVTDKPAEIRTRLEGTWRVAVSAADTRELAARVATLTQTYAQDQGIELVHTRVQPAVYREFIPTGRDILGGHRRRMPGQYAATAVPQATATLGDDLGPLIGFTESVGRKPVMFDPNFGPMRNMNGLGLIIAPPGQGKSYLAGILAEQTAHRGRQVVMFDPAGSVSALTRLPHFKGKAQEIDLSGARPGTLVPYRLVHEPRRQDYGTDGEYRAAVASATVERRELTIAVLSELLSFRTAEHLAALEAAVAAAPATRDADPWEAVNILRKDGNIGAVAAAQITASADLLGGALLFPAPRDNGEPSNLNVDQVLTVISLRNLDVPSTREATTRQERITHAILRAAARYVQLSMYVSREPKLIVSDEMGITGGDNALTSLYKRGAVDSRRWNTALCTIGQNPSHIANLTEDIANLFGWGFVGKMKNLGSARDALRLLGVPTDHGYERTVTDALAEGVFLMKDYEGVVDVVHVHCPRPEVAAALNTTPGGGAARKTWTGELTAVDLDEPVAPRSGVGMALGGAA